MQLDRLLTDWLPVLLVVETMLLSALVTTIALRRSAARQLVPEAERS